MPDRDRPRRAGKWCEGTVDPHGEHIKIAYGEDPTPVALVANIKGVITAQFLPRPDLPESEQAHVRSEVRDELDYYFVRLRERNPWGYAIYHCTTAANIYSPVHWGYFPEGTEAHSGQSEGREVRPDSDPIDAAMLPEIREILTSVDSTVPLAPPTLLYNEGWLLRLVLGAAARGIDCLPCPFLPDSRWFTEGLLYSPFKARRRGDRLAEGCTHADGLLGHWDLYPGTRAGVILKAGATQFVVVEAKMFSRLSRGTTRAPAYNHAARSVGCMAWALKRARRPVNDYASLGFYVLAPKRQISERNAFADEMAKEAVLKGIEERVALYDHESDRECVAELRPWVTEWAKPLIEKMNLACESWESVIAKIAGADAEYGSRIREFYRRCLIHNSRPEPREAERDEPM
jgi:hypothetical protein